MAAEVPEIARRSRLVMLKGDEKLPLSWTTEATHFEKHTVLVGANLGGELTKVLDVFIADLRASRHDERSEDNE